MFDKKFLDLFYKGTTKQRYIDRAVNLALFLGVWLPAIMLVASLFDFTGKIAGTYYLLDFSGFFGSLPDGIDTKYTIVEIVVHSVSLITVITAILFRITRIPVFGFILIVDVIAGYVQSLKNIESYMAFNGTPLLNLTQTRPLAIKSLPLIATVFMIAVVIVYLMGFAGSSLFYIDFIAYRKQKVFIQGRLPAGTDVDMLIQNMPTGKNSFEFRISSKDSMTSSVNGFVRAGKVNTGDNVKIMDGTGRLISSATVAKVIFTDKKEILNMAQPGAEFTLFLQGASTDAIQRAYLIVTEGK